jgi:two-component system, OmpR family, copper resistance phosphate regulon response regulator CusR
MMARRVLVIEDDEGISNLLKRGLGLRGIEAVVAEDGVSGREAWKSGEHDLVLLDVMLPGVDGVDLLTERRAAGSEVPVILLTARDEKESVERGLEAGAQEYVSKPFSFEDLLSRVESYLPDGGSRG